MSPYTIFFETVGKTVVFGLIGYALYKTLAAALGTRDESH